MQLPSPSSGLLPEHTWEPENPSRLGSRQAACLLCCPRDCSKRSPGRAGASQGEGWDTRNPTAPSTEPRLSEKCTTRRKRRGRGCIPFPLTGELLTLNHYDSIYCSSRSNLSSQINMAHLHDFNMSPVIPLSFCPCFPFMTLGCRHG